MNLNRTEELEIKKDIKGIKKALEDISNKITPVKPTTQVVVKDGDPFFGKIHMSQAHMDALDEEFNTTCLSMVGLMEECAELQQAASKYYRKYRDVKLHEQCTAERAAMIEELTHVLIDIRMICHDFGFSPEEIQQEIYKKYPDGYDVVTYMADNVPYYAERNK